MDEKQTRVFWTPVGSVPELVTKDLVVYSEDGELRAARPIGTIRMTKVQSGGENQPGCEMNR
jgi:hypothetical protein